MELERLKTFRDVAHCGSIAAATRLAGCDPFAISRRTASLQATERVGSSTHPTRRERHLVEPGKRSRA